MTHSKERLGSMRQARNSTRVVATRARVAAGFFFLATALGIAARTWAAGAPAGNHQLSQWFEEAYLVETGDRDPQRAIALYRRVIESAPAGSIWAAKAQLQT